MSHTKRKIPKSRMKNIGKWKWRFDKETNTLHLTGFPTPWKGQKMGKHAEQGGQHKGNGKWAMGHGGINCPCCSVMEPSKVKVKIRRYERHKRNEETRNMKDVD